MGLFGGTKIAVASSVSNLAGPELLRPNYLKTTVLGNILTAPKTDIPAAITRSYLKGPRIKLRNFFNWAATGTNYNDIGMFDQRIGGDIALDIEVIRDEVPQTVEEVIDIQLVETGVADVLWWAEEWVMVNYPEWADTLWTCNINEAADTITITWEDESTSTFTPTGFDKSNYYLRVVYQSSTENVENPVTTGTTYDLDPGDPWPSTSGWTLDSSSTVATSVDLDTTTTTTITYSDSTPGSSSSSTTTATESYDEYHAVYSQILYEGKDLVTSGADRIYSTTSWRYLDQTAHIGTVTISTTTTEDIGGGVTKTTVVTTVEEIIILDRSHRTDSQEVVVKEWSAPKTFIYAFGTGNTALDGMLVQTQDETYEFYPFIPVRIDNQFLSPSYAPSRYNLAKKAYKKAVDGDFDALVDKLAAHENLADMDYAWIVFGVSANVVENSCRRYLYEFFSKLKNDQQSSAEDYALFQAEQAAYEAANITWNTWYNAQSNSSDPLFGTAEPIKPAAPAMPKSIFGFGTDVWFNYQVWISWNYIEESTGSGLAKPEAKVGEVWFGDANAETFGNLIGSGFFTNIYARIVGEVYLYHQVSATSWRRLKIVGMTHKNYVYGGKFVETSLFDAIIDADESGFIVPLHEPTLKTMSMRDTTQMSTACVYLVINCYVVKKTSFFSALLSFVIVVLVFVALSFINPAFGAAFAGGIGGAAAGMLGLTGLAALIAAVAINALVAMILTAIISRVAIAIFGEKLGAVIGMIASFVMMQGLNSFASGNGFVVNFGSLSSAKNLIQLTSVAGNAVSAYMEGAALEKYQAIGDMTAEYKRQSEEFDQKYFAQFGLKGGVIDPLGLLDHEEFFAESPNSFLNRTLMTGTDIAQLSHLMLNDFCEISLTTELFLNQG